MIAPTGSDLTPPQITTESAILGALNFPALTFHSGNLRVMESNRFFNNETGALVFDLFDKYDFNFINYELVKEIIPILHSGQQYIDHKLINTANEIFTYAVYASLLPDKQTVFIYLTLLSGHTIRESRDCDKQQIPSADSFRFNDPRYWVIADQLPFGVYRTKEKGTFLYANPAFAKILKYSSVSELYRHSAFDLYTNPGDRIRKLQNLKQSVISKSIFQFKTKTGEAIRVRDIGWACYNDEGEIDYLEGIIEDVTEQKLEIQKIHEQSNSLKEMIQDVAEGIGQINDKYILTFCNKSFATLFGTTPDEMIGENLLKFVGHENRAKIEEELELNYFRANIRFEIKISPDYQGDKFVLVHAIPKLDGKNNYKGTLLLLSDITDRVTIERDLLESNNKVQETERLKASFLANVSHEIRTPMNSILGFSSILKRPGLTRKKRDQYLDIIINHGKKLMDIINDIIDLTIIEENQAQINLAPCNLNEVLSEISRASANLLEELKKPVKLLYHTDLTDENSVILTDGGRIRQILRNLLSNSIKFTEAGLIEIGYRLENMETIVCYVKDTGIGVPPEIHRTIFERFRQADESITRSYGGTGLGLTICQGLVKLLGGQIWVESEGTLGSTFYFTLPYYPFKEDKITLVPELRPEADWKGKKILLIEDDPASSEYLTEVLSSKGCNVMVAGNGYEALGHFRANESINLVLLDIQLPEMDGYEVARKIRGTGSKVPIIAQTAHSLANDRKKCLEAGCNEYMTKPIPYDTFLNTIKKYIEEPNPENP